MMPLAVALFHMDWPSMEQLPRVLVLMVLLPLLVVAFAPYSPASSYCLLVMLLIDYVDIDPISVAVVLLLVEAMVF